MSSPFSEEEKLSAGASSQHCPVLPTDGLWVEGC
jgi:hypothetical protein